MLSLLRLLAKLLLEMLISKCSQRPDDHSGAAHRRLEYRLRPRQLAVALVIWDSVHAPSSICLRNASFRCLLLLTVCCLPCHSMLLLWHKEQQKGWQQYNPKNHHYHPHHNHRRPRRQMARQLLRLFTKGLRVRPHGRGLSVLDRVECWAR